MSQNSGSSTTDLRPAVFIDRDGTLIDDIGYLADPEGINFYPDVFHALRKLKENGYLIVVITNQSGVGRGYFNEETALKVNFAMLNMLVSEGVRVDAIYYCPHHPDDRCRCRKPGLLMVERAISEMDIDLNRSWVIGDVDKDIQTGLKGGIKPILVETGKPGKGDIPADVHRCPTVVEAVDTILTEDVP